MSDRSKSWWPIWLAPFGGAIVTALLLGVITAASTPGIDLSFSLAIVVGAAVLSLPTLTSSWVFGTAASFVFERYSIVAAWVYCLTGFVLGIVGGEIWCVALNVPNWRGIGIGDLPPGYPEPERMGAHALFGFGVMGAISGTATALIYWLMVRPDRDAPNPASTAS